MKKMVAEVGLVTQVREGALAIGSLMCTRVSTRPCIPSAEGVVSCPLHMLTEGTTHEELKSCTTSVGHLT